MEHRAPVCVSIYMKTFRTGVETRQGPIRLKNLLREAEKRLEDWGLGRSEIDDLLDTAEKLVDDGFFWNHQSDGLAVFISPEFFRILRLPHQFDEIIVVTQRFHLKPLLPLLSSDGLFYVLALSKNETRLLRGSRFTVDELALEEVPTSLAEALKFDDPQKQLQFHTGTGGTTGKRSAIFHGHGVGVDDADHKVNIQRFFKHIDSGIHEILREEHAPLILAGVEYLWSIYREVNSYPHLLDDGIPGNTEELDAGELHDHAWPIAEARFLCERKEAVERYHDRAGTGRTANRIEDVFPAAREGRVDTIFVALDEHLWGTYDPDTRSVQLHEEPQPGSEDLLDGAAVHTWLTGGTVWERERGEVPDETPVAALLRY